MYKICDPDKEESQKDNFPSYLVFSHLFCYNLPICSFWVCNYWPHNTMSNFSDCSVNVHVRYFMVRTILIDMLHNFGIDLILNIWLFFLLVSCPETKLSCFFGFLNVLLQRIMNFSNASITSQVLSLSQTGCHDDLTMAILQYRNVAIQ